MLSAFFFIACSASAVLGQDTIKLNPLSPLLSQVNYLPGFQIGQNQPQVVSGVPKQSLSENCPANKILQKIEVILLKVLNDDYDRNLVSNQVGSINTVVNGGEKLILPLSKVNSLRELLENNSLHKKLRTKVTVKYELPSAEELNCKQALTEILKVLREAKLMHEYYRTCSPKDNCPSDNVVDIKSSGDNNVLNTAINQGNSFAPSKLATLETEQNSVKFNDGTESNQDLNKFMKYLLSHKGQEITALLKNYKTSEQLNLLNDTASKELLEKFNIQSDSISDGTENLSSHEKIALKQILNPAIATNNQNTNISNLITQALLHRIRDSVKVNQNVEKKSDSLVAANDLKIDSLFPSENIKNIEADSSNDIKINTNIDTGVPDNNVLTSDTEVQKQSITKQILGSISDDTSGNNLNVSNDNVLSALDTIKSGTDYNQLVSMLKFKLLNQQIPTQQATGNMYPGLPFATKGGKYLSSYGYPGGSVYRPPYQISPYNYPNMNPINNNPRTLNNHKMLYQSLVKTNPFLVNPKMTNNVQQIGQQIYEPHNLLNPQRFSGVTDQSKFNFATDNTGIVELTYMLKQPNPVVYQPVYFVKYRLPYDSFISNLKELLVKKPHLRSDPSKLYQEMIAVSNIAEVSPNLKGVGKEKLTQMVATNGALVKTKVLKVNDTLLSKQLETVQNLNSILTPNEIVNLTYSVQVNSNKQENSEKVTAPSVVSDSNEINIKYLRDFLSQDHSLRKDLDAATTVPTYSKLIQNFVLPNIPTLR